jgi:hypothetical protein
LLYFRGSAAPISDDFDPCTAACGQIARQWAIRLTYSAASPEPITWIAYVTEKNRCLAYPGVIMARMALRFMLLVVLLTAAPQNPANGSISGTLKLPNGIPAAGIRVAVMEAPNVALPAGASAALVSIAQSDSEGRYQLENIPPGRYYLTAGLVSELTYYPGGFDRQGAVVITVGAGAALSGYDFTPGAFPVAVKGNVHMIPAEAPFPQFVTLRGPQSEAIAIRPDGSFAAPPRMLPGEYTIAPVPPFNTLNSGQIAIYDLQSVSYGNQTARVSSVKIDSLTQSDLTLTFAAVPLDGLPPITIRGKVVNIAREAAPLRDTVWLTSAVPGLSSREAALNPDNSYVFVNVPAGLYKLSLSNMAQGGSVFPNVRALSDVTDANIDLRNNPFPEFPAGSRAPVFNSNNPVTVRGRLTQAPTQIQEGIPLHYFRLDVRDEKTGVLTPWAGVVSSYAPELLPLKAGDTVTITGTGARDGTNRLSIDSTERNSASINGVPLSNP